MRRISCRSVDFIWSDNDCRIEIEKKNIHVFAFRVACTNDWKIVMYNTCNENDLLYNEIIENISHYEARQIIMDKLKTLVCKAKELKTT